MTRFTRSLGVGVLGLLLASSASARNLYVRVGALAGDGSCTSPYGTIAAALTDAAAVAGDDEIRITQGIYAESDLLINFSDVILKGGYPTALTGCPVEANIESNRNPATLVTTVDAQQVSRHIAILPVRDVNDAFVSANTNIRLDGITFTNGKPADATSGGSIAMLNCDARITNCTFRANGTRDHFVDGGAIYQAGYATDVNADGIAEFHDSNLVLQGSLFDTNQTGQGGNGSGSGGAIYAVDFNFDPVNLIANRLTTLNATSNIFRSNTANGSGDLLITTYCMVDSDGDGVPDLQAPNDACPPILPDGSGGPYNRCHSQASGGAVSLINVSGTWDGNTFESNRALALQTGAGSEANFSGNGGAFYTFSSANPLRAAASPRITNNTFNTNTADAGRGGVTTCGWFSGWGGAVYAVYFTGDMLGNTFTGNQAAAVSNLGESNSWGGGALIIPGGSALIDDNEFRGNQAYGAQGAGSSIGGGAYVNEFQVLSSPRVTNNLFDANEATGDNQVSGYGGGLAVEANGPAVLIARNTLVNNGAFAPEPAPFLQMGWGGGLWARLEDPGALIADNVVKNNTASELDPVNFNVRMAGIALGPALVLDNPDAAPRLQNNLVVQNNGVGVNVMGFIYRDLNGDRVGDVLNGADFYYNTIADNAQSALMTSMADTLTLHGNILFGNDTDGDDWPTVRDFWFQNQRDSTPMLIEYNIMSGPFEGGPAFDAEIADATKGNLIDVDPEFATDLSGEGWYLRQPADQGPPVSPGVDRDPTLSAAADFGPNANYSTQFMSTRTTKSISKTSDLCFTDLGYHHPLVGTPIDSDSDGVPDADEVALGILPLDADTDDDGVPDGLDCGPDLDGDGTTAALDCDTDGDALTDGTERGVSTPAGVPDPDGAGPAVGTDVTATCDTSNALCGSVAQLAYTRDDQPTTTTDPLNPDTDNGFESDGCEDVDHDGRSGEPGERNPTSRNDDDADRDNVPLNSEVSRTTDPLDADTDDDGIRDDLETDPANLFTFSSDPVNCDTDGDGILDGVERSLGPVPDPDGPNFPSTGTDCPRDPIFCVFVVCPGGVPELDQDPTTRTQTACVSFPCEGYDTDDDGCHDGIEDANKNGLQDGVETDPNDPLDFNCSVDILILDDVITSLSGGVGAACGPLTQAPMATLFTTACGTVIFDCNDTLAIPVPTLTLPAGSVITDGAAPSSGVIGGRGVLVFYETPDCTQTLIALKQGRDVYLDLQP